MKRKSVENISDKRMRLEVQPAQTCKAFVNVHLHWIVSTLKRISKFSTSPPWKYSADVRGCTDFTDALISI